jgi:hypothetical protein
MYKASVEPIPARIYTLDLTLEGVIHLQAHIGTSEYLNSDRQPFLPITQVRIQQRGYHAERAQEEEVEATLPFLTVPKARILWVVGGRSSERREMQSARESRTITLLYPDHFLQGEIGIMPGARVSDYLVGAGQKRFQNLYNASAGNLRRGTPIAKSPHAERFAFVTFNLRNVAGIFDGQAAEESA